MKLVSGALEEDRCATCEELSRAMGVPATSVFRTLTNDLKKKIISARWVRFDVEYQALLRQNVANDETWIKDFEPELKSESNEWRAIGSPRPNKFRRAQ